MTQPFSKSWASAKSSLSWEAGSTASMQVSIQPFAKGWIQNQMIWYVLYLSFKEWIHRTILYWSYWWFKTEVVRTPSRTGILNKEIQALEISVLWSLSESWPSNNSGAKTEAVWICLSWTFKTTWLQIKQLFIGVWCQRLACRSPKPVVRVRIPAPLPKVVLFLSNPSAPVMIYDRQNGGFLIEWYCMYHWKAGTIIKFKIKGGYHGYGRLLRRPVIAYYEGKFRKNRSIEEVLKLKVAFKLFSSPPKIQLKLAIRSWSKTC